MPKVEITATDIKKMKTACQAGLERGENLYEIYRKFDNYFDTEIGRGKPGNKDWIFFLTFAKKWKQEYDKKAMEREAKEMSEEMIDDIQSENRKRMILLLRRVIEKFEKNPRSITEVGIDQVIRLYDRIQAAEEAAKRTEIAAHKEKRETVLSFLPYQRISKQELKALLGQVQNAIEQLEQPTTTAAADEFAVR